MASYTLNEVRIFLLLDVAERELQDIVYKRLEEKKFRNVFGLSSKEVMAVTKMEPAHFYIMPHFSGEHFEHLKKLRCKILNSFLILYCLGVDHPFPRWTHPIYSLSLEGTVVCFSGFTSEEKEEMAARVKWMSGLVSRHLSSAVTHLVVNSGVTEESPKIQSCRRLNIPVLSRESIDQLWEKALHHDIVPYRLEEVCAEPKKPDESSLRGSLPMVQQREPILAQANNAGFDAFPDPSDHNPKIKSDPGKKVQWLEKDLPKGIENMMRKTRPHDDFDLGTQSQSPSTKHHQAANSDMRL